MGAPAPLTHSVASSLLTCEDLGSVLLCKSGSVERVAIVYFISLTKIV